MQNIKKNSIYSIIGLLLLINLQTQFTPAKAETEIQTEQTIEETQQIFTDVTEGSKHYLAIKYLKENNLINGYDDNTFKPTQLINRAEALKMLFKAFPDKTTTKLDQTNFYFPDVTPTDWFYSYVIKAWSQKITKGYSDKKFHPERTINKAESLKIILEKEEKPFPIVTSKPYSDVPTTAWFAKYAQVAKDRTLFLKSRQKNALYPADTMTRGDFAELIYRTIQTDTDKTKFARTTWYGDETVTWGTASGEKFDVTKMTAAHKTLPFGTTVEVTNITTGKTIQVKINDRGPYANGMDLDLTRDAFAKLASIGTGVIICKYTIINSPEDENKKEETTTKSIPEIEYSF